jgi:nuclear receptor subfamily 1 group F protein 4
MSRYYEVSQNAVLFMEEMPVLENMLTPDMAARMKFMMLPMESFLTTGDTTEMSLVSQIFDFARTLAEMQLSETALSLYSAYILLQDGTSGHMQKTDFQHVKRTYNSYSTYASHYDTD